MYLDTLLFSVERLAKQKYRYEEESIQIASIRWWQRWFDAYLTRFERACAVFEVRPETGLHM